MLLVNHYMPDINKDKNLTSATKNRATTSEDWIGADCIHVFLTAMRSAKWFEAERTPMKSLIGCFGKGLAFQVSVISSTLWGEKLGWEVGREVA